MTKNMSKTNGKVQQDTSRIDALLAAVSDELIGDDFGQVRESTGLRVEQIPLDLVRPDPVQPRRILPDRIHHAFHNQQLTPMQALRELVQRTQVIARQNGRPFSEILDLIPDPDGEHEVNLSPEETLLRNLVTLALTIRDDGQVNPLTVVDVSQGVATLFRIETGERRYWASWLLRDFVPDYKGDSTVPCIVVPREVASPFRQAKENTARSGLSAIAMARQVALLLLTVHDFEIPAYAVTNDFYRQALDLHLRGKSDASAQILAAMGGISKMRFSQIKALLSLSDEAMELADRHQVDEYRLRYVLNLPVDQHEEMVRQIIDFNLTGRQIKEICELSSDEAAKVNRSDVSQDRRVSRLLKLAQRHSANEIAKVILAEEKDSIVAKARIERIMNVFREAYRLLGD